MAIVAGGRDTARASTMLFPQRCVEFSNQNCGAGRAAATSPPWYDSADVHREENVPSGLQRNACFSARFWSWPSRVRLGPMKFHGHAGCLGKLRVGHVRTDHACGACPTVQASRTSTLRTANASGWARQVIRHAARSIVRTDRFRRPQATARQYETVSAT